MSYVLARRSRVRTAQAIRASRVQCRLNKSSRGHWKLFLGLRSDFLVGFADEPWAAAATGTGGRMGGCASLLGRRGRLAAAAARRAAGHRRSTRGPPAPSRGGRGSRRRSEARLAPGTRLAGMGGNEAAGAPRRVGSGRGLDKHEVTARMWRAQPPGGFAHEVLSAGDQGPSPPRPLSLCPRWAPSFQLPASCCPRRRCSLQL